MQLNRGRTGLRVQPFNPCLPDPHSLVCSRWIPLGSTSRLAARSTDPSRCTTPYDAPTPTMGAAIPFSWPAGILAATANPGWDGHGGPQGPLAP